MRGQFLGIQFLIFDFKSSRDLHSLRSLGKLSQNLASTKDAVSMPYLSEWVFFYFSWFLFPRAYRHSTISNTSFLLISRAKFIFTLKIYVTDYRMFLSWILEQLSFSRSSSNEDLWSLQTTLNALTCMQFKGWFCLQLWNNHKTRAQENWDVIKAYNTSFLWLKSNW